MCFKFNFSKEIKAEEQFNKILMIHQEVKKKIQKVILLHQIIMKGLLILE